MILSEIRVALLMALGWGLLYVIFSLIVHHHVKWW